MRRKTARRLQPHLPALRRHARSVTGGAQGAALVEQTLDQLRARDYRDVPERDLRTRLFRDFHDVYTARGMTQADTSSASLSETDRHGLMLRHAQGFSVQDVATILRGNVLTLQDRLDGAYATLHAHSSDAVSDVLLIQEDPVLASGMTEMIESLGHRVLGVARDEGEALAAARVSRLDAVVADVHSGPNDKDARARMERMLGRIGAPIVVVMPDHHTGHDDQHAPAYSVATPYQASELKVMLTQALQNRRAA